LEPNVTTGHPHPLPAHRAQAPVGRTYVPQAQRDFTPPAGMRVLAQLSGSLQVPTPAARRTSVRVDPSLVGAYGACTQIIRDHSKSFYFSARLLPAAKRHSIMALYAFCRTSDDLVDSADSATDPTAAREQARIALDRWANLVSMQESAEVSARPEADPRQLEVKRAWLDTRTRHDIPADLADELLAGVRMDLTISRYETWDDLWLYCYRVASTVGLMSMYIMGADDMRAVPYAVQLGVALQLTNILRDVGEDARAGRIYLPAEDLERFGYTEEMLLDGVITPGFVALMNFQIERATALYNSALPGVALLSPDSRLAVTAAATVYRGILNKIIEARYDVFNRRAHLSTGEKLRALPQIWWRSKRAQVAR
jgi:15-cis-phytoene synthase